MKKDNSEIQWDWIDTYEVMTMLHVSYNTVRNLIYRGLLHPSHLGQKGRKHYFRRSDIEHLLEANIVCDDGHIDSSYRYAGGGKDNKNSTTTL